MTAIGFRIINIDCIVFAQRPKLLPYRQTVRERIADILQIEPERIGLKGKTGEGVGPIGLEEAISAECVALLEKSRMKSSIEIRKSNRISRNLEI